MKSIAFALLLLIALPVAAGVLGTAHNQNGTVIEFSDGTFPKYCGDQNTARITSPNGTATLACYFDNGHVVTVTPIYPNSTGSIVLGAVAGQPRNSFRLGPAFTVPTAAVAWNSSTESEWVLPGVAPQTSPFTPHKPIEP
jgi:hypothetical protein